MWTRDDARSRLQIGFKGYAQVKTTKRTVVKLDVLSKETSMTEKPGLKVLDLVIHGGKLLAVAFHMIVMMC